MSSSSMEHSSTLDPRGTPMRYVRVPNVVNSTIGSDYTKPVKVLMLAPFQYKYGNKSYWVTTGEWYSLDPIKDREEIIYLDSPSNPYRQFMYIEGQAGVGNEEEKGGLYASGIGYQDLVSDPAPPLRSNALIPPEDPAENPHIVETLVRAGLNPAPVPVATTVPRSGLSIFDTAPSIVEDELIPTLPDDEADLPRYGDEVMAAEYVAVAVVEGIEAIPQPTALEMKEAELRSMRVPALKSLAATMGLEYKDKESTINQILVRHLT
ncbi:hypothetical protein [Microcoleus phage My-WqHQDG]|nr:hypothetical protein [Microcoleus phage My-WqHQDG]